VVRHKESKTKKESQYGGSALKDKKAQSDITQTGNTEQHDIRVYIQRKIHKHKERGKIENATFLQMIAMKNMSFISLL
jgi:hypothetical protein